MVSRKLFTPHTLTAPYQGSSFSGSAAVGCPGAGKRGTRFDRKRGETPNAVRTIGDVFIVVAVCVGRFAQVHYLCIHNEPVGDFIFIRSFQFTADTSNSFDVSPRKRTLQNVVEPQQFVRLTNFFGIPNCISVDRSRFLITLSYACWKSMKIMFISLSYSQNFSIKCLNGK